MTEFSFISTFPGKENYALFEKVIDYVYPSQKGIHPVLNKPSSLHLKVCIVLLQNKQPIGRLAFYENPSLSYLGEKACSIGSYECIQNSEASQLLIEKAKDLAREKGYSWLIGPMEGSTWNNYRFSLNHDSPSFFMEPFHHLYYNNKFIESGFEQIKTYVSQLLQSDDADVELVKILEKTNRESGFTIRNINLDNYEQELQQVAKLSLEGFNENFLFTPISVDEFVAKYLPLKSYLKSELIFLIENKNRELEAFIFCVPDYSDLENKTLIVKSIVKKKESQFKKLGLYTTHKIKEIAQKKGYTKIIHAFMANDNVSNKISQENSSEAYKNYVLYGVKLEVGS